MKDNICWYCSNYSNCKKRTTKDKCVNFIQDVPFPMSRKDFESKYKVNTTYIYDLKQTYLSKDYLLKHKLRKEKLLIAPTFRVKDLSQAIKNQEERILKAFYFYNLYKKYCRPLDYSSYDMQIYKKKLFEAEIWL